MRRRQYPRRRWLLTDVPEGYLGRSQDLARAADVGESECVPEPEDQGFDASLSSGSPEWDCCIVHRYGRQGNAVAAQGAKRISRVRSKAGDGSPYMALSALLDR